MSEDRNKFLAFVIEKDEGGWCGGKVKHLWRVACYDLWSRRCGNTKPEVAAKW
jgi:hypothetical protein